MARKPGRRRTDVCPHCGAEYLEGRPACPECGSDAETGWSEAGIVGTATELPTAFSDEDYDEVLRDIGALPPKRVHELRGRKLWLAVVGLIVVASMLYWALGSPGL